MYESVHCVLSEMCHMLLLGIAVDSVLMNVQGESSEWQSPCLYIISVFSLDSALQMDTIFYTDTSGTYYWMENIYIHSFMHMTRAWKMVTSTMNMKFHILYVKIFYILIIIIYYTRTDRYGVFWGNLPFLYIELYMYMIESGGNDVTVPLYNIIYIYVNINQYCVGWPCQLALLHITQLCFARIWKIRNDVDI